MNQDENLKVLYIQEQDRKRIAQDLHDISLQNLAHLTHKLELAGMMIDSDPVGAKLELHLVNKKLHETMDEIRNIIFDLRPMSFDDLGLKASFERLLSVINEKNEYEMILDISDVSCENELVLVNIFRIVKEILFNIVKHAKASRIEFSCYQEDEICYISISDNGVGFDENALDNLMRKHFGISFTKERINLLGGNLLIQSHVGEGVNVSMEIPLMKV
ncbi:MAG: sensor histidine kinase [Acetatifactor sp.]|nr:sensor histidine kinase [Acetatifactor sp.]